MNRLDVFEMWAYGRILKIPEIDKVVNKEVLKRINKEREILLIIKRQKLRSITADNAGNDTRNKN